MIKRFLPYYKPHKNLFLIDFISAFFVSVLTLFFPYYLHIIIDKVLPNKDFTLFLKYTGLLLFIIVLKSIFGYIVIYWGHILGLRIRYDLRNNLFNHLQKLSLSYFDKIKTGELMSRIVGDLEIVSELAHHGPEDVFLAIITLIGSFIIMFSMNFKLALPIFIIMPFFIIFAIKQNKKMKKNFRESKEAIAEMNSQLSDSLTGIRLVKAFANEKHNKNLFKETNKKATQSVENAFLTLGRLFFGVEFFNGFIQLVVVFYGGYMVLNGNLTIGILASFLLFVNRFLEPIKKIINILEMYQNGMAGFNRYEEIMGIDPDIKDILNPKELDSVIGEISFNDVEFSYDGDNRVLSNFNLNIKSGEKLALVGNSGAGKSTVCALIPRFYEVNKGSVKIDGIDVREISQNSLRKSIGIVQQDVFLFNDTIKNNVLFGKLDATDKEVYDALEKANALDFVMKMEDGIDTVIGERGVMLSGGQKQRISIARIFLNDPKILILDEATSALDNITEKLIQKSLSELSKDRTTLIIAHRLSTIKNAHRIILLNEEGIIEEGTHKELYESGKEYKMLYDAQFGGLIE